MKKLIFTFLLMFVIFQTYSTTIVYVDINNVLANDANTGTDPTLPWKTLNPTKWADDMIVNISNGTYTITTKIGLSYNITLIGQSLDGVIIQSLDDATYTAGSAYANTLFQTSGNKSVTFKNMTLMNVRNNVLQLGGAFDITGGSTLNLTNMILKNLAVSGSTWSGGGAIFVRGGTLNVDSCVFNGCQANFGGAIMTYTNSSISPNQVTIQHTKFLNNSNPNTDAGSYHFGGAIVFSGKGTMSIDKCYFEANASRVNTSNGGSPSGGAIIARLDAGATSSLNITNSTFYKNESDGNASVFSIGGNGVNSSTVFNLNMTNNVIFQNKGNVYSGTAANTIGLYRCGVDYTGTFIFANNTFFQNYNDSRTYSNSISLEAMPVTAHFINNLMNDNEITGVTIYGLACTALASNTASYRYFKGNIFNSVGGSINVNTDQTNFPDLYQSNSNSTNGNRSFITNSYQKINTSLTIPAVGVPYLDTQTGGMGVNFGVDTYMAGGTNVVPTVDIRGNARNGTSDAGAFELGVGITTSIKDHTNSKQFMVYSSSDQIIKFNTQVEAIKVFSVNGTCVLNVSKSSSLNVSELNNGMYLIRVIVAGVTKSQKFIKK